MFSQGSGSDSFHNRPHGYTVTAHPCYGVGGTQPTAMFSCLYLFVHIYAQARLILSLYLENNVFKYKWSSGPPEQ